METLIGSQQIFLDRPFWNVGERSGLHERFGSCVQEHPGFMSCEVPKDLTMEVQGPCKALRHPRLGSGDGAGGAVAATEENQEPGAGTNNNCNNRSKENAQHPGVSQ